MSGNKRKPGSGGGVGGSDDGSWSVRYSPATAGIPDYDASRDSHVPFTKTDRFRKHMREVRRGAERSASPQKGQTSVGNALRASSKGLSAQGLDGVFAPGSMRPMEGLAAHGGKDKDKLQNPNSVASPGGSTRRRGGGSGGQAVHLRGLTPPGKGPQSLSTSSGGVTMQFANKLDDAATTFGREDTVAPEMELEVLKAILLREGYLHRIAEISNSKEAARTVPHALPDLLDLVRIASVEVVETIVKWRKAQLTPLPFDWNGVNYLLKMPSDLDFLSTCRPLVAWLGFDLTRNPFVVPLSMEQCTDEFQSGDLPASGVQGFTDIGTMGNVTLTPQQQQLSTSSPTKPSAGKQQKTQPLEGRPFATAVVNDQTIVPAQANKKTDKSTSSSSSTASSSEQGVGSAGMLAAGPAGDAGGGGNNAEGGHVKVHPSKELSSSQVQDGDLLRVRVSERVLLAEEAKRGKWTRSADGSNRVVPANQAEAARFLQDMEVDDLRPAVDPSHGGGKVAPFAETGGMGLAKRDANGFVIEAEPLRAAADAKRLEEMQHQNKRGGAMPGPQSSSSSVGGGSSGGSGGAGGGSGDGGGDAAAVPGRARGKRTGGELGGMSVASTVGRRKAPVRKSRGARLDSELVRNRAETLRLSEELASVESTLAALENELSLLDPPGVAAARSENNAAVSIQAKVRGGLGREVASELKRRRQELESLSLEANRRREELASRQRELAVKEEQHAYYKQHQKREQDRKRAAALERKRRLLDEGEVLPEDEENAATLEDVSAAAIQRIARGRAAWQYAKALRESYAHAATIIEAGARGMFHRRLVRLLRRRLQAAIRIQCQGRAMLARMLATRMASHRKQWRSASLIGRCYRGLAGRIRHARKRMLVEAARGAALVVDVKHLFPADLLELSEAIAKPLVDATVPFPPAAVLGLMRILVCVLDAETRGDTVTAFSAIGVKSKRALTSLTLGWEDAMRVLRRCHKLLRQLRALAAGPAARRPRLLYLPREAMELMAAYGDDPVMSVAAMRRIGSGAKAASHLLAWVKDLVTVHELQRFFLDDIGDVLPGWLKKQRARQKKRRHTLVSLATRDRSVAVARDCVNANKAAGDAFALPLSVQEEMRAEKGSHQKELVSHDDSEAFIIAKEEAEERRTNDLEVEAVRFAARDLEVTKQEYAEKRERAERGGKAEELLLPKLLAEIQAKGVALKEMQTRLKLALVRREKSGLKRREWFEHPHEVRFKAAQLGEAEALHRIATLERLEAVKRAGGEMYVKGLRGRAAGEMATLDTRLRSASDRVQECSVSLRAVNQQFEKELERVFEEERRREALPGEWNNPSEEEVEEDLGEDESQALEEAERSRFFVTKDLLEVAPSRPRPLMVCVGRDVSGAAKTALLSYLTEELPGMFVHVDSAKNHGVDVAAMQRILSTGQSVICEVDVGLSSSQREAFLAAVQVAKRALVPSPSAVLALGDVKNRVGELGDDYLGCTEADLRSMSDGRLKRTLQAAQEAVHALGSSHDALDAVKAMGDMGEPPSRAHAVVLEAAVVLLTPTNRFRPPSESVAGMAWAACRLLLSDPIEFVQRLREVDPSNVPPPNLDVLRAYLGTQSGQAGFGATSNGAFVGGGRGGSGGFGGGLEAVHRSNPGGGGPAATGGGGGGGGRKSASGGGGPGGLAHMNGSSSSPSLSSLAFTAWPSLSSAHRDALQSPVLARLLDWIEGIVSFATELSHRGGPPRAITKRSPPGLFAAVVPVRDAVSRQEEHNELSTRGWRAACVSLVSPVLEDMRVHREAVKLNGVLHTVNVFRDCHRIFFNAYDPTTSLYRTSSISVSQVNKLLAPNSIEASEFGAKGAPTTTEALYHRLVELLSLETLRVRTPSDGKASGGGGDAGSSGKPLKKMVCRRKLTLLMRETRKVSGHLCTVTIYEEAKGELRAHLYLPEYSAAVELDCGGRALKELYVAADPLWEQPHLASQDAMRLLKPVADRLEVRPTLSEVRDMGRVPRPTAGVDPAGSALAALARHQGFRACLRGKQGPGRLLFRRLCVVSRVQHVMSVREYGRRGLLRVRLYEPISAVERELRLSPCQRVALLESDKPDDWRVWVRKLDKRLSLKRRAGGAFGLHLSHVLLRTAKKLSGALLVGVVVYLEEGNGTGNGVRVACQRPSSQDEWSFTLTAPQVGDLLGVAPSEMDPVKDVLCCGQPAATTAAQGGSRGGAGNASHGLSLRRRRAMEQLVSCLWYDEASDEVVLATPGSVEVAKTQGGSGRRGETVTVRRRTQQELEEEFGEGQVNFGQVWVRRVKAKRVPGSLQMEPPPPTEGFGSLRPLPERSGNPEDVSKARKQPMVKRYVHAADASGPYKHTPKAPPPSPGTVVKASLPPKPTTQAWGAEALAASESQLPGGFRKVMVEFSDTVMPGTTDPGDQEGSSFGSPKSSEEEEQEKADQGALLLLSGGQGAELRHKKPVGGTTVGGGRADGKFPLVLGPGQSNALNAQEGERMVFNQAVKVHCGEVPELSFESTMVVKVFERFSEGMEAVQRSLRLCVYDPSSSVCEDVTVVGDVELREAVGPESQHLFAPPPGRDAESAILYHLARWRLTVVKGVWNEDTDCYERVGDRFTLVLKKDRLYATHKETPLNASGGLVGGPGGAVVGTLGQDGSANVDKLIDDATRRGIKVLRQGASIDGVLMHVTAFELPDASSMARDEAKRKRKEVDAFEIAHGTKTLMKKERAVAKKKAKREAKKNERRAEALERGEEVVGQDEEEEEFDDDDDDDDNEGEEEEEEEEDNRGRRSDGTDESAETAGDDEEEDEDEPVPPTLRFVGYNPKTGHKSLLVVPPQAVLEVLCNLSAAEAGELSMEEVLTRKRRLQLCKVITSKLRLEYPRSAPPELVLPWSGANFGFLGEVAGASGAGGGEGADGAGASKSSKAGNGRPIEERPNKRENRVLRCSMQLCKINVVVTAFKGGGQSASTAASGSDLSINLYYPRIQESCEVAVSAQEQAECLGRSVFELDEGEPRTTAIEWLCRRLDVKVLQDPNHKTRKILTAVLVANKQADWVAAYKQLDTTVPVKPERVEGVPMKFIPSNTRGDLVLRKGVKVRGGAVAQRGVAEALVSVFTRAPKEPPGHGLVIECYNADTSYTSVLHVEASELRRQVAGRDELLTAVQVKDTVESLMYRLVLKPSPVGGLSLSLDMKLMPNLFD